MAINRNFIVKQGIQVGANATCGNTWTSNDYISDKQYVLSDSIIEYNFTRGTIDSNIQTRRLTLSTTVAANGKIVIVAANTPRIEYSLLTGECLGLVCEEQRTNLSSFSDIEGAIGQQPRGMNTAGLVPDQGPTVSADFLIGPNKQSARHVRGSTGGGDNNVGYLGLFVGNNNTTYTFSTYVYIPSTSSVNLCNITFETGTLTLSPNPTASANLQLRDQWQRLTGTCLVTAGSGSGNFAVPVLRLDPIGAVVYTDCWQVEQGEYASTWIPTENVASATRTEDYNFIKVANNVITPQNLSVYVEGAPKWSANVLLNTAITSGGTVNSNRGILHIGSDIVPFTQFGGEPYYGYGIGTIAGNATFALSWNSRGLSNTTYNSATSGTALGTAINSAGYSTFIANTTVKIAAVVDTALSRVGINGSQTSIDTNSNSTSLYQSIFETFPFNRIVLGLQAVGGVGPLTFGGHVKRFALYPRLLSNTEIIALTET